MAKRSNKQRKPAEKSPKTRTKGGAFTEEDIDDEIDAFHKQRDVVPLDVNEDEADTDDETEHAVFDLESGEASSDNSEDEEHDDEDEEIQDKGFAAKIARQAKYLQQKFGTFDGEMDDDDNVEEEDGKKAVWGRRKSSYYDADNVDYEIQESDEENPMEEEAEVVKIQKERAKSFEMENLGFDSDSDGQEKFFQDAIAGKKTVHESKVDALLGDVSSDSFMKVNKDVNPSSKDEQMEVVYSHAPEIFGLLEELDKALNQLKQVKPLLSQVTMEEKDITKGPMKYLELKHILLLTYCQAINFYLLLKSEGHSVLGHPVIPRLVQIKNMLGKLEQVDLSLPSHVEDTADNETDGEVKLAEECAPVDFELNLMDSSAKTNEIAAEPSQLIKGNPSKDLVNKKVVKNLQDAQVGLQSMEMLKVRANLEAKLKEKGIYNSSDLNPARTQKLDRRRANQCLETLDDFEDEVQQTAKRHRDSNDNRKLNKSSQLVATKGKKQKIISGDDDLPKRDDIGERRRKYELRVLARTGTTSVDEVGANDVEDEEDDFREGMATDALEEDGNALESEDDFHEQVKKQRANKLAAKAQLYSRTPPTPNQIMEIDENGKRHITYQMEKNRGLTRPRKKLIKNPRVKNKRKHQKAVMRRKGQARDIRKPSGPYGGESTGVNINVSRSIRFRN